MLEINIGNKKVQMLSVKEMKKIPLINCDCGKEFRPLPDTYVNGKPYCTECRMQK